MTDWLRLDKTSTDFAGVHCQMSWGRKYCKFWVWVVFVLVLSLPRLTCFYESLLLSNRVPVCNQGKCDDPHKWQSCQWHDIHRTSSWTTFKWLLINNCCSMPPSCSCPRFYICISNCSQKVHRWRNLRSNLIIAHHDADDRELRDTASAVATQDLYAFTFHNGWTKHL